MTAEYKALCAELLQQLDWLLGGPVPEESNPGRVADRARAALAAEEAGSSDAAQRPTEADLLQIWTYNFYKTDKTRFLDIANTVIDYDREHYGSTPRPIPVAERLPGAGDYLDEGWAWYFNPRVGWRQAVPPVSPSFTHWLPAHALPLPAQEGADG
jgi:hypothetical protein